MSLRILLAAQNLGILSQQNQLRIRLKCACHLIFAKGEFKGLDLGMRLYLSRHLS